MRISFILLILLLASGSTRATHLRSGCISLKLQSGLTYTVTLRIFTNTSSEIRVGDGVLDFGDGSTPFTTPVIENTTTPYPNVGTVSFSVVHIFPKEGTYVVSYTEPNLNEGIANITNSVETRFYLESGVTLVSGRDSSSPEFLVDQFFEQTAGSKFSFSSQAVDQNDYRLTYSLAVPLPPNVLSAPSGSTKYKQPADFSVNHYNGLVSWAPNSQGQYLFAVRVNQYDQVGSPMGFVTRTFLVRVADGASDLSTATTVLDVNRKVFVDVNGQRTIRAVLSDNVSSTGVKWDAFFDNRIAGDVALSYYDSAAGSKKMKVALITLTSTPGIVRDNPYSLTLRGTSTTPDAIYSEDISYLFFTRDIDLPAIVTSTDEMSMKRTTVYPNPFSHYFYVDRPSSPNGFDYRLLDINGKVLMDERRSADKPIDGSYLPTGVYILETRSGFVTEQHRLVKQY